MSSTTPYKAMNVEAWAGEVRVNLIRLLGLVVFYSHHLIQYQWIKDDVWRNADYHNAITALVVAWGGMVGLIHLVTMPRQGQLQPTRYKLWMKYAITLMDLLFIFLLIAWHRHLNGKPVEIKELASFFRSKRAAEFEVEKRKGVIISEEKKPKSKG